MNRIERDLEEIRRESSTRKFSIFEEEEEEEDGEHVQQPDEFADLEGDGDQPAEEGEGEAGNGAARQENNSPTTTAMPQSLRQLVAESREGEGAPRSPQQRKQVAKKGSKLLAQLANEGAGSSPKKAMLEQLAQQRIKYSQQRSQQRAAKQRTDKENDVRRRSRSSSRSSSL